jgi:hypothetical protein
MENVEKSIQITLGELEKFNYKSFIDQDHRKSNVTVTLPVPLKPNSSENGLV